jgi:predicted transcriptional regulator
MTPDEFRATVRILGLRQRLLARALGVEQSTVYRWSSGKLPVPRYVELCLTLLATLEDPNGFCNQF